MMNRYFPREVAVIYVIRCVETDAGAIRYIGKTSVTLASRLAAHISKARSGETKNHCANWIRATLARGHTPVIEPLCAVPDGFECDVFERFFIASARHFELPITNATAGGEGIVGPDADALRRRVAAWKLTRNDPLLLQRWSQNLKAASATPKTKALKSAAASAAWSDAEKSQRILDGMRTDEARERRSQVTRTRHADPEYQQRHAEAVRAAHNTPEAIAQHSLQAKAMHARPGHTERVNASIKAAHMKPETKARMREVGREIGARPEVRAAKSESLKASWAGADRAARGAAIAAGKQAAKRARHLEQLRTTMEWDTV